MTEEWRDVPGFEGLYQIDISTKEGKCRSLNYEHTGKPNELSNKPGKRDNRIIWGLSKNGKCITRQQVSRSFQHPDNPDGLLQTTQRNNHQGGLTGFLNASFIDF